MKIPLLKKKIIFGDTVKMKLGISGTIQKNVTQPLLTLLISLSQIFSMSFQLIKRLDIGNIKDQQDPCGDYMASVKDCNLREILAKEILTYDPPQFKPADLSDNYAKLNQLMKVFSMYHF